MENKGNFRKALFGFNTKDVMEYIAMLHNEYYAFRQQHEQEVYDLMRRIDELEEKAASSQEEAVFSAEHEEILGQPDEESSDRIALAAQRLEDAIEELEGIIKNSVTQEETE